MANRVGAREVMEVRDNLAAIGRHACPGFDCGVCQSSHNIEMLDEALARINAPTPGELLLRPGSPEHVALWGAINRYAEACGGSSSRNIGSTSRMNAVVEVERALAGLTDRGGPKDAAAQPSGISGRLEPGAGPDGGKP